MRVLRAWVHAGADQPFLPWHEAIMEGRAVPGFGGLLAKATGNSLWGQFCIDDTKRLQVQRWNGGYTSLPVQGSRGHQRPRPAVSDSWANVCARIVSVPPYRSKCNA